MAKLPLDRYCEFEATKVLTINHVFDIMVRRGGHMSWPEAIEAALPGRKEIKITAPAPAAAVPNATAMDVTGDAQAPAEPIEKPPIWIDQAKFL